MATQHDDSKISEADEDILHSDDLIDLDESLGNTLEDLPSINTAKHSSVEETQQAAEMATQASEEAKIIALTEAQAATDAKAAAEQAIAMANAAERLAQEAEIAAQIKAVAEVEAVEEAEAAIEAELKAEEEARTKAEEEARAKAEEEARAKAEEEARAKAEEEARAKERIDIETDTKDFLNNNIDEEPTQHDAPETLSSIERDLGELTDWVEPENQARITTPTDANLQSPITSEKSISDNNIAEQPTHKDKTMPLNNNSHSNITNSIMLSIGLVAMLIAAIAIWMSLDASQKATNLASAPGKLQLQIDRLEQQYQRQQQHLEDVEHQLKNLTKVIANKTTEQWRSAIEKPVLPTTTVAKKHPAIKAFDATIPPSRKKPELMKKPTAAKQITKKTATPASKPTSAPVKRSPKITSKATTLSEHEIKPSAVQGWVVYLFSDTSEGVAQRVTRQYRGKSIDAKYVSVISKGKRWYHVLVSGFETEQEATGFKTFVKEYHGIKAWHNKSARTVSKPARTKTAPSQKGTLSKASKQTPEKHTNTHKVRFKAINSDIWLQVFSPNAAGTGKGKLLKDVLLRPNDFTTITTSSESLWITTGNAPALSISVDGKVMRKHGTLGTNGKVLRDYRFGINTR